MANIFTFIFLFVLGFYLWYTFVTIYHLIRFGVGKRPKIIALVFFIGSFILFGVSLYTFGTIPWRNIFENILYPQ